MIATSIVGRLSGKLLELKPSLYNSMIFEPRCNQIKRCWLIMFRTCIDIVGGNSEHVTMACRFLSNFLA